MTSYFKFGDITIKVPEKMIVDDKQGNPLLKDTLTKSGNLSTYLGHKSIQIKDVANLERIKIVTDQPAYKQYVKPAVKKRGRKPKPTPEPTPVEEIKLNLPIPPIKVIKTTPKDATNLLKLISTLEQEGSKYEKTGIVFNPSDILGSIMYEYLIEKYNVKCFVYGVRFDDIYQMFTIDLQKYGLGSDDKSYIYKYQKYVFKMIKLISNCIIEMQNTEREVLIIPLSIKWNSEGHTNMLIYRKSLNVLEHYEPHGSKIIYTGVINEQLKKIMIIIVTKLNQESKINTTYIPPNDICPHSEGFQVIENELIVSKKLTLTEKEGMCTIWSIFFAELSLLNPTFTSKEIFNKVFDDINQSENKGLKAKNIIRGYLDVMYTVLNPIVFEIAKINIGDGLTPIQIQKLLTKTLRLKKFDTEYSSNLIKQFLKYTGKDMNQYFKEPEKDFTELKL
jgi:hypothetical protein